MHSPQRGVSPGTRGQPSSLPSSFWFAHLDFCLQVQASGHLPGISPYTYSKVGQDREFHSYKGNQHLDSLEQPPAAQGRLAVSSPGGVTSHPPPLPHLSQQQGDRHLDRMAQQELSAEGRGGLQALANVDCGCLCF